MKVFRYVACFVLVDKRFVKSHSLRPSVCHSLREKCQNQRELEKIGTCPTLLTYSDGEPKDDLVRAIFLLLTCVNILPTIGSYRVTRAAIVRAGVLCRVRLT